MILILWVFVGVLWTVVILAGGVYAGIHWNDDEDPPAATTYVQNFPGMRDDEFKLLTKTIERVQKLENAEVQVREVHHSGLRPEDRKLIDELAIRVKNLEGRDISYQDRFKRVERKLGLSV